MKNFFKYLLLSLILFNACTKADIPSNNKENSIISFSTSEDEDNWIDSKANIIYNHNFNDFGIFSYVTGNEDFNNFHTPNYIYNNRASRFNTTYPWSYSPIRYWPEKDKLSFFALAPYNNNGAKDIYTVSASSNRGLPTINYKYGNKTSELLDLMYSNKSIMNITKPINNNNSIKLDFKHLLSYIQFKVKVVGKQFDEKSSGDYYTATITNIDISNINNEGECKFNVTNVENNIATINNEWVQTKSKIDYNLEYIKDFDNILLYLSHNNKFLFSERNNKLLFIPQNLKENGLTLNKRVQFKYEIKYVETYPQGNKIYDKVISFDLGDKIDKWEAGKKYTYLLTIGFNDGVIENSMTVDVSDWDNIETDEELESRYLNVSELNINLKYSVYNSKQFTGKKIYFSTNGKNINAKIITPINQNLFVGSVESKTNEYYINFPYNTNGQKLNINNNTTYELELTYDNLR